MSSIRTRNARKVAKNAKKFLQSASKSSNSLDHRRAVNGHWLKHANLMPVLQFLAAKAEGTIIEGPQCLAIHFVPFVGNSKGEMIHLFPRFCMKFESACEYPRSANLQLANCLTLQNNGGKHWAHFASCIMDG